MSKKSRNYYHDPDDYNISPLEEEILLRIGSDEDDSDISISESLEDQLLSFTEEEINQKNKDKVRKGEFLNNLLPERTSSRETDNVSDFTEFNFSSSETGDKANLNNNQVNERCGEGIVITPEICVQKDLPIATDKIIKSNSHCDIYASREHGNKSISVCNGEIHTRGCEDIEKKLLCDGVDIDNEVTQVDDISNDAEKPDQHQVDTNHFELDAEEKEMLQLREDVDNILADIDDILNSTCGKETETDSNHGNKSHTVLESVSIDGLIAEIMSHQSNQSLNTTSNDNEQILTDSSCEARSDGSEVDKQESINSNNTSSIEITHKEEHLLDSHHKDDVLAIDDVTNIWQALNSDDEQPDNAYDEVDNIYGVADDQSEEDFGYATSTSSEGYYKHNENDFSYNHCKNSTTNNNAKSRFIYINPAKIQTLREYNYEIKSPEFEIEFN